MEISTKQAPACISAILKAGLVPMLHGSPGTAKSSIAQQIAKERNLKVIDLRLSQSDPTDLAGFPVVDKETNKAGYVPMDTFPIKGDKLPAGYKGWLLLLDEFNSAPMSVQAAAYKLVLDRAVGQHDLHDRVYIIAAGNLASDRAITNRLSTAMQSRMVHLEIALHAPDWIDYANSQKFDFRVVSYIGFRPEILHNFDADHQDMTFPCARTWEFVSKLIKPLKDITNADLPVICGAIGEGAAREFVGYCKIFKELPSIGEIINNPQTVSMPDEPSILYAITGLVSEHTTTTNIKKIYSFLKRLPIEFQVICLQAMYRKNTLIDQTEEWKDWTTTNAQEMM